MYSKRIIRLLAVTSNGMIFDSVVLAFEADRVGPEFVPDELDDTACAGPARTKWRRARFYVTRSLTRFAVVQDIRKFGRGPGTRFWNVSCGSDCSLGKSPERAIEQLSELACGHSDHRHDLKFGGSDRKACAPAMCQNKGSQLPETQPHSGKRKMERGRNLLPVRN